MRLIKQNHKKVPAFSLLETVISIAIIAVIMVMLNNIVINFASASQKTLARSFVREEISTIVDQITTDVRSATRVGNCTGTLTSNATCDVYTDVLYRWQVCGGNAICKTDQAGTVIYRSSPQVELTELEFSEGLTTNANNLVQRNILITIVGRHRETRFGVNNVVRQSGVSTRNYVLL